MPDIRALYEKDFLGQWDVCDGDLTLTLKGIEQTEVPQPKTNKKVKKVVMTFKETDKKMVLNATNREIVAKMLGTYDYTKWPGNKVTLYKDASVKFARETTGGLRIRAKAMESSGLVCDVCGKVIDPAFGMTDVKLAEYTQQKYSKQLCAGCAKKEANND